MFILVEPHEGACTNFGVFSTKEKAQRVKDFEGPGCLEIVEVDIDTYDSFLDSIPPGQKLFEVQIFKIGKIKSINDTKDFVATRNVFQKCDQHVSKKILEKQHCKIILTAKDATCAEGKCLRFRDELVKENTWEKIWD
jgi:hypothetical protein